jgi:hypothetical protein
MTFAVSPRLLNLFPAICHQNLLPKPSLIAITPTSAARRAPVADRGVFLPRPRELCHRAKKNAPSRNGVGESWRWGGFHQPPSEFRMGNLTRRLAREGLSADFADDADGRREICAISVIHGCPCRNGLATTKCSDCLLI